MSDIFENGTGVLEFTRSKCRVAYTINNSQPVLCTIIGDQPLFYMDFDVSYEDEILGDVELGILEKEVSALRHEIKSLERLSCESGKSTAEKMIEFEQDALIFTAPYVATITDIEALKAGLLKSRLASAYLDFAEEHKITIVYSGQVETAFYDRNASQILINPVLSSADQQLLLTQELRRHWQHRAGALIHPLMFHPDNAILVNRAQMADLVVSMVRVAWELQLSGEKAVWERIENSSMADLGRAFAREAFLDFRTINNGQASAAVFESWFLSERCRAQDKIIINQMLADYQGYVFELEQTEQAITPTLIAALGSMPFGKNYLAEHALTIIDDAIFTDVRDRSNANFLWFIKFERSFRETEQELQISVGPSAEDVRSPAHPKQDQHHETNNAQVLQFFAGTSAPKPKSKKSGLPLSGKEDRAKGSNVVYLRRWSGD
jgi:hypothetical protein